ncbi:MAG: hypothetical protein ACXVQU_00010 [Actinomycetota bacterium]
MARNEAAVEVWDALEERRRFAESELTVEIARSLREIQTRIQTLAGRGGLSESEIDVLHEVDELLYDAVLDLTRVEAREPPLIPFPA